MVIGWSWTAIKPRIQANSSMNGRYICSVHSDDVPNDEACVEDWYKFLTCGIGDTIEEAYLDWVKDWEGMIDARD